MSAEDFACGLCARLLDAGLFVADSLPHREIMAVAKAYWPAVRNAIVTDSERMTVADPRLPQRLPEG